MRLIKLGMLAATSLLALTSFACADRERPVYKGAPPPLPPFSWTGFYIGGNAGAGWGTRDYEQIIPTTESLLGIPIVGDTASTGDLGLNTNGSHGVNGFLGGVQLGFNFQTGWAVFGTEFEGEWAGLTGKSHCGLAALFNCHSRVDGMLTLAGRFGMAVDRALIYVKAGWAWAHDQYDVNFLEADGEVASRQDCATVCTTSTLFATRNSLITWRNGPMIGTGIEYAFRDNWTAKIEYSYMDFGTQLFNLPTLSGNGSFSGIAGTTDRFDITERLHMIKFGVNYRFGSEPAATRRTSTANTRGGPDD